MVRVAPNRCFRPEAVRQLAAIATEEAARAVIRDIPDGTYSAQSLMDDDGLTPNKPIPLKLSVTIAGDDFIIDMSELPAQAVSPINSGASGGGEEEKQRDGGVAKPAQRDASWLMI